MGEQAAECKHKSFVFVFFWRKSNLIGARMCGGEAVQGAE